ncbi:MAG TPA: TolC family protein, partial [Holophaga sp.]|nr:TolC family protein [Holophaga sp.]
LDPMWSLGVGVSLPVWSRSWRQHAVAEQELRRQAQGSEAEGLGHLLEARIHERAAQLDSALAMLRLYRGGLLVQSQGTFQASLAQYEAGKAPLASVLEALNGWIADQSGLLQVQAQAQAIAIAQEELSLGPVTPIGATGLSAATPGGAASSTPMTSTKAPTSPGASSASNPSPMPSM